MEKLYLGPPAIGGGRAKAFPIATGETASLMDQVFLESTDANKNERGLVHWSAQGARARSVRIVDSGSIGELPDLGDRVGRWSRRRKIGDQWYDCPVNVVPSIILVEGVELKRSSPMRLLEVVSRVGMVVRVPLKRAPGLLQVIDRSKPPERVGREAYGAKAVWVGDRLIVYIDEEERAGEMFAASRCKLFDQHEGCAAFVHTKRVAKLEEDPPFAEGIIWESCGFVLETMSERMIATLRCPRMQVRLFKPMIEGHVERRIALFFQQLVVCFCTGLEFDVGKTVAQAAQAKKLWVMGPGGKKVCIASYEGAHSSTLPTLSARKADGEVITYLWGASTSCETNATNNMPKFVNGADSQLDGSHHSPGTFRHTALAILNRASRGEVEPQAALGEFVNGMIGRIDGLRRRRIPEERRQVFGEYRAVAQAVVDEVADSESELFDQMLGMRVDHSPQAAAARRTMYRIRFDAIRKNQQGQAALSKKIDDVAAPLKVGSYFDQVFRERLLAAMPTDGDRSRLRMFWNSAGPLQGLRLTTQRTELWNRTDRRLAQHAEAIAELAGDVHFHLREMSRQEILERAAITRKLRHAMGWTQAKLGEEIRALYPDEASSQPTISRCETAKRVIDMDLAIKLSEVFNIDPVAFIPAFFSQ